MDDYSKNKARLYGLLFECPYYSSNPEDCGLYDVRKKPVEERIKWADSLSKEDVNNILAQHRDCLRKKENG